MKQQNLSKGRKILPTITTTWKSDWKAKIKETNELKLKEVALFTTCLKKEERKELYKLLKNSSIKSIPFCHLRNDMDLKELDFLAKNFKTRAFTLHTQAEYPLIYDYSKYKDIIYIENVYWPFDEKEIKNFGGICLDFSHLENDRLLNKERLKKNLKIIEKYLIGGNHISAIKKVAIPDEVEKIRHDSHYLEDLSELDYLKKYPLRYFSPFCAIELENSIKEQLSVRNYIINLLHF